MGGGPQAVQNAGSLRILASQAIATSRMLPKPRPNQLLLFESLKGFHSFKRTANHSDTRIGSFLSNFGCSVHSLIFACVCTIRCMILQVTSNHWAYYRSHLLSIRCNACGVLIW